MSRKKVKTPEVKTPEVKTPEVKTPEVKTPEVKTPEVKTPKSEYVGKELHIVQEDTAEFRGLCTSERDTPSGRQVYVQLNGVVSRFFNVDDILE